LRSKKGSSRKSNVREEGKGAVVKRSPSWGEWGKNQRHCCTPDNYVKEEGRGAFLNGRRGSTWKKKGCGRPHKEKKVNC